MELTRKCIHCLTVKPLNKFYIYHRNGKINHQSHCKCCDTIIKYKKIKSECGSYYAYTHKKRHFKSAYHVKRAE